MTKRKSEEPLTLDDLSVDGYIPPIPTKTIGRTRRERNEIIEELVKQGWRLFTENGLEFIVPSRYAIAERQREIEESLAGLATEEEITEVMESHLPEIQEAGPRATFSIESVGKNKGKRIDLIAWPYHQYTIDDIDFKHGSEEPISLKGLSSVVGYAWTDDGIHIYRKGKFEPLAESDKQFEHFSKYSRGWYGDRLQYKDGRGLRTLVTTDEDMARAFLLAGGNARVVRNLNNSYVASRAAYRRTGRTK